MVIEVRNMEQGLKEISGQYYAASGISGIGAYFKKDKPFFLIRLWVQASTWIILPQVTLAHIYTALFTGIPLATRFLSLSLGLDQLQTTIKCHYMLHNLDRFRSIMLQLETFNCVNHLGFEAITTMLKMCKLVKWLRSTYNFACYFTFIAWTLVPVVSSPKALFYGEDGESMMKVLPPEYPFATDYFPMIQFIYGLESLSTFVILTYFASTNLIMVTDILLICQLFRVLNDSVAPNKNRNAMSLRMFAVDHQKLLKICAEVRDLLSPLLALQLGISVMTITLAVFEITMVNQASSDGGINQVVLMSRKTSYTFIIFVELLLYCWLSTELELSCLSVRNGIYNSEWYERLGTKDYRNFIMISMRALRPVKLNAMKIATLSLGTSLEVLRMAYSYYTYLKRLH
uniref:Odorant receptor n=1 Tax=Adelphocoris lineolatus TaxID=236346 RepID=A0A2I4PH31_ADELI|nr:olfactory receptor 28 [Adelphocoris lineolatus]